jgi:hypothetical protein
MKTLKIQTANGIYDVRKPGGKLGARNMIILSKLTSAAPMKISNADQEDPAALELAKQMQAEKQMVLFGAVFEEWAEKILPNIVDNYDEIPGEDQLAIFMALTQDMNVTDEFFQILPATPSV